MSECETRGFLPPPPPGLGERRMLAAMGLGTMPHHWQAGPADVTRLDAPRRVRLRDGGATTATHEFRWFLDRVEGTSRREATKRLYDVFLDPNGWIRTGVHMRRVRDATEANLIVRVVPQDTTVCGPGSLGCYSWRSGETPVAEVGVECIDNEPAWLVVAGMECVGHAVFRCHDGYINHTGYQGVLGDWGGAEAYGFRPSPAEIDGAKAWLAGATLKAAIHDHD